MFLFYHSSNDLLKKSKKTLDIIKDEKQVPGILGWPSEVIHNICVKLTTPEVRHGREGL